MRTRTSFTRKTVKCMIVAISLIATYKVVFAQTTSTDLIKSDSINPAPYIDTPVNLEELKQIDLDAIQSDEENSLDLRKQDQKNAAFSFGARGALIKRTWEHQKRLNERADKLDQIWRFDALVSSTKGGFILIPDIVIEASKAVALNDTGRLAASSERSLQIVKPARLALIPPHWRDYLERSWAKLAPPPSALHPKNSNEEKWWNKHLELGWEHGLKQADEIHQADLDLLSRDFEGMVLYKTLLAEKRITPTYTYVDDKGIVGGGNQLSIGEQVVRITGNSSLNPDAKAWIAIQETPGDQESYGDVSWKTQ